MKISRRFASALAVGAASLRGLRAQTPAEDLRIPTGQIAGHALGRALVDTDGFVEVIAYYPLFAGVGNELWATGERSERSAFFALRTGRFRLQPVQNGRVFYSRLIPLVGDALESRIFYNPSPNRNFDRPETFSETQVITTLRSRAGSITAIEDGEFLFASTAEVVSTADFSFQGRRLNLRDTGVFAYTVSFRGPSPAIGALQSLESLLSIPVAGSFVAAASRG
ncbi:MAG: hypothetical protein FJW39_11100 [Acidobacteria bacterium]|nr:hypothetical protein [Acidobacteriota bacterium]